MASGIDCEDSELDRALDEIIGKEKFADTNRNESSSAQAKKDKAEAEKQRLKAVERLGETAKRQADTDGKEIKPKKARSGSENLVYLRDKFEYKKEELALRVKELESKDAQQKMMAEQQRLIQQQQHDMLQMMQKQKLIRFADVNVWNHLDESIKHLPHKTFKNKVKLNILQSYCS